MKVRTMFLVVLAIMLMGCTSAPAPYGRGGRGQGYRPYKHPADGSSLAPDPGRAKARNNP